VFHARDRIAADGGVGDDKPIEIGGEDDAGDVV